MTTKWLLHSVHYCALNLSLVLHPSFRFPSPLLVNISTCDSQDSNTSLEKFIAFHRSLFSQTSIFALQMKVMKNERAWLTEMKYEALDTLIEWLFSRITPVTSDHRHPIHFSLILKLEKCVLHSQWAYACCDTSGSQIVRITSSLISSLCTFPYANIFIHSILRNDISHFDVNKSVINSCR